MELEGNISNANPLSGQINSEFYLEGNISTEQNLSGKLANTTLRGFSIQLRISGTILQWKYENENEWRNLMDLNNIDYERLANKPVALTNLQIERLLADN